MTRVALGLAIATHTSFEFWADLPIDDLLEVTAELENLTQELKANG